MAFIGTRSVKDDGIAGRFLIEPEGAVGEMGNRVPPMERKHRQRREIHRHVMAVMMRQFMRNGEALLLRIVAMFEIGRHDHRFAEHAQRYRGRHGGTRRHGNVARIEQRPAFPRHLPRKAEVGQPVPPEKENRTAQPDRKG